LDGAAESRAISADSPTALRTLAEQCRRLARGASTAEVAASLKEIAAGYENLAARADAKQGTPPAANARK
jgi:hypothetical protein